MSQPLSRRRQTPPPRGSTLAELIVVLGGVMVVGAVAVPAIGTRTSDVAASGAARHLAGRLQSCRIEAVRRAAYVAYRFHNTGDGIRYAMFADGNGNGVRAADIGRGVDSRVSAWESVTDHFSGVSFSITPGVVDIDSGTPISGDPIRIGGSDLLSFSPTGTATSGTIYLSGRHGQQYALRILGATGRTRMLRFVREQRRWVSP